jgi:flap endonuclease-1
MLDGFDLNYDQFVDLCILCGCDYTPTVDGIGPITAYKLIKAHDNLESVLIHLEKENLREDKKKKFGIP